MGVTVDLSGLPKNAPIVDLAKYLQKLLHETDKNIGNFAVKEVPPCDVKSKVDKRHIALTFDTGFEAMNAQQFLDGYEYTLDNGITLSRGKLRARVMEKEWGVVPYRGAMETSTIQINKPEEDKEAVELGLDKDIDMVSKELRNLIQKRNLLKMQRKMKGKRGRSDRSSSSDEEDDKSRKKRKKNEKSLKRRLEDGHIETSDDSSHSSDRSRGRSRVDEAMSVKQEYSHYERSTSEYGRSATNTEMNKDTSARGWRSGSDPGEISGDDNTLFVDVNVEVVKQKKESVVEKLARLDKNSKEYNDLIRSQMPVPKLDIKQEPVQLTEDERAVLEERVIQKEREEEDSKENILKWVLVSTPPHFIRKPSENPRFVLSVQKIYQRLKKEAEKIEEAKKVPPEKFRMVAYKLIRDRIKNLLKNVTIYVDYKEIIAIYHKNFVPGDNPEFVKVIVNNITAGKYDGGDGENAPTGNNTSTKPTLRRTKSVVQQELDTEIVNISDTDDEQIPTAAVKKEPIDVVRIKQEPISQDRPIKTEAPEEAVNPAQETSTKELPHQIKLEVASEIDSSQNVSSIGGLVIKSEAREEELLSAEAEEVLLSSPVEPGPLQEIPSTSTEEPLAECPVKPEEPQEETLDLIQNYVQLVTDVIEIPE